MCLMVSDSYLLIAIFILKCVARKTHMCFDLDALAEGAFGVSLIWRCFSNSGVWCVLHVCILEGVQMLRVYRRIQITIVFWLDNLPNAKQSASIKLSSPKLQKPM